MDKPFTEVEEYNAFETPSTTDRDCDFIDDLLRRRRSEGDHLLDLGCGTGRHAMEMARRGYRVTGVDLSADRIAHASEQAVERKLVNCTFTAGDLLQLDLQDRFTCAYCLFDTVSLFVANDDVIRLFRGVRGHLADDGIFVIHLFNRWQSISEGLFDGGDYEATIEHGGVVRHEIGHHTISPVNNTYRHTQTVHYSKNDGRTSERTESTTQRAYAINEIELICRLADLSIHAVYDGMDTGKKIEDIHRPGTDLSGELAVCMSPGRHQKKQGSLGNAL